MQLLLLAILLSGELPAEGPAPTNLDFRGRSLAGWEGEGFQALPPKGTFAVASADADKSGGTALLHRTLVIPPGAGVLRFSAQAVRPAESPVDEKLDVVLLATGKRILPRSSLTPGGWKHTPQLQPTPTDYRWDVSGLIGHTLRIALLDDDIRPGCHVACSGFRLEPRDAVETEEFSKQMVALQQSHRLHPMLRYDSRHFTALSNADEAFSEGRLRDCELIYTLFWDHFRRRGFTVRQPEAKLTVAIFDSQIGFNAYLGRKMSPLVTGIYHTDTNRLVTYDYGQNEAFLASVRQHEQEVRRIGSQVDRQRYVGKLQRQARDHRTGANIGTIMHEVAHQLSFNCGLLNRGNDVPVWLAEGLACYCEPTADGSWQGIGALNPSRMRQLATMHPESRIPMRELLLWNGGGEAGRSVLQAYAQSWALFRMLIEERPAALKTYLDLIRDRRTPDHRLADFQQAFGADLQALDRRHGEYIQSLRAAAR